MKKILFFLLCIGAFNLSYASHNGTCGTNLKWVLDDTGTLTISGTGRMTTYNLSQEAPWTNYANSINKIIIEDEVTTIGAYAFYNNCGNVKSLKIGEGVKEIESKAFYSCSGLTSLIIPDNVKTIRTMAFDGCSKVETLTIGKNLKTVESFAFPDKITTLVLNSNSLANNGKSLGSIIDYWSLSTCIIGTNVKSLGRNAFASCYNLLSITLPTTIKTIANCAFKEDTTLQEIVIPDNVTFIGDSVFLNCHHLQLINLSKSLTSIGKEAFLNCSSLTSIDLPNENVSTVGKDAFKNCNTLTTVNITNLSAWCNIAFNNVYSNPLFFAKRLFVNGTKIINLEIPDGTASIGAYAFVNCKDFISVTIPDSVTSIGENAFYGCTYLDNISIGSGIGINGIGQNAFANCTYLLSVTCKAEYPPVINANVFEGCGVLSQIDLYVPEESVKRYRKADVWSEFNIIGANFDESSIPEKYEITWLNYDGSELYVDSLEYGVMPEYTGETPKKESTAAYAYTFNGWKPNIVAVTSDAIYIAQFESHKIEYNVDVTIPDTVEVHGSVTIDGTPTYGETVTLTPQPEDGYVFEGWSDGNTDNPREVVVDGDVNIYPIFHKCEEIITLTEIVIGKGESYKFGGKTYTTRGIYYDTITLATGCDSISTLKLSVVKKKTFNLRAVVDSTQMAYGTTIGSGIYNDGQTVTIEAVPASSKYVFARWWNPDEGIEIFENPYTFALTRNLTLKAVFKRAPKRIVVKQQGTSHTMSHPETDIVAVIEVGEKTATVNNPSESTYRIYDSAGHLIITSAEDNTYALPSGLYFIQIDEQSEKFIIQ